MIASIQFRHFKALRAASLRLEPFNLVIGPNGSGKSSLIQAILRLRNLAQLPIAQDQQSETKAGQSPELIFSFAPPYAEVRARLVCLTGLVCDLLKVESPGPEAWCGAKAGILGARIFAFDHYSMGTPVPKDGHPELAINGGNLAAVLAYRKVSDPEAFSALEEEAVRLMPEFSRIELRDAPESKVELGLVLKEDGDFVPAEGLSQGDLYMLALLALAFDKQPPSIVCIEDVDRGIHPRMLREIRDLLYRLSYPESFGHKRKAVQVIATTHSPYLLDQFRDHPDEVVIAEKHGRQATFSRLSDRADINEILQDGSLGDIWFSGVLGGVPDEGDDRDR